MLEHVLGMASDLPAAPGNGIQDKDLHHQAKIQAMLRNQGALDALLACCVEVRPRLSVAMMCAQAAENK